MRAEKHPLTVQPKGFLSGYIMSAHQTLAAMPAVWERFALRDYADAKTFIRIWSWQTEDDETALRPFIVVMLPVEEFEAANVSVGGPFLPQATVWVYLTDLARFPDQDGFLDWTNFVGAVINGFVATQRNLGQAFCRIDSIKVMRLRRTDSDIDGSEAGQEGTRSKLEAFWEAVIAVHYSNNG